MLSVAALAIIVSTVVSTIVSLAMLWFFHEK